MSEASPTIEKRGFRAPGTGFMVGGGLLGALGAYLFQMYGTRTLGLEGFEPVGALWTLFFILATVLLVPVEQYVTREVARGRKAIPQHFKPTGIMALLGTLIGLGYVWWRLDDLFEGDYWYLVQIGLLMGGYGLLFMGKGVLAGSRNFSGVGWVLIIETAVRFLAGVLLLYLALSALSLGWAMVIGGFAVLVLRWWRHDRGDADAPGSPARGFLVGYVGGSVSAQLLLGGAPLLADALGAEAAFSIMFVTFTLFRAPLTLIFALQGRILPYLVGLAQSSDRSQLIRIVRHVLVYGAVLAVLGGVVGWLVGPQVVALLYGAPFEPSALLAALAAAGVMAAAAAQITSQVLVAEGRTRLLGPAWTGGLAAALVVTFLISGEPDIRVAIGFVSGEFVAFGLMALLAIRR